MANRFAPAAAFLVAMFCLTMPARAADPFPVAVLNMDRIFKTYQPLLDKLTPIKQSAQELDKTAQLRGVELETVANQLRKTQPGTQEYNRLTQQAAKLQNDLQQFINSERQNHQKREAAVYLAFYRELDLVVRKYAKEHGLKLVVRQSDSSLDENQPLPEVLKALNRQIIFEDDLDITDEILVALSSREGSKTER